MGLFNRKKAGGSSDDTSSNDKKEKGAWRRPANTAFKQQRLKAWQPILTPRTVLPTLFLIGVLFGPIGGLLIWGSSQVSEITIDYSRCDTLTASTTNGTYTFQDVASDGYAYNMKSSNQKPAFTPRMAFLDNNSNSSITSFAEKRQCIIEFDVPATLGPGVFLYYKLSNFYQNHRRYVKSLHSNQLRGNGVTPEELVDSDCKPLGELNDKAIYPCGLIANSMFNDTFSSAFRADNTVYQFSDRDIAWPGEASKYVSSPIKKPNDPKSKGYDSFDDIVPPPNWALRYPGGVYNSTQPPPDLKQDLHFQNWMRTAGLPIFSKLYGRNDAEAMQPGTYRIIVGLNFPVLPYNGKKGIIISTVSWSGGKNPFLGYAYIGAAGLFILLAAAGTVRHLVKPRRLGDMSMLSWNR